MSEFDALIADFDCPAKRFGSVRPNLKVRPLATGLSGFDQYRLLRANCPDLCVIGARPGNGKTSFLVQVLRAIAKAGEGHTMLFSLEMDTGQLVQRALASELAVPMDRLGSLPDSRIEAAQERINQEAFFCDDQSGLDINTLRARAMTFKQKHGLAAVGVDYIQLVSPVEERSIRREEVMQVVTGLKQLAKDLSCPVVALAQMSRDIEKRQANSKNARPVMSDLQECGGIENFADQILFLDGAGKRDPSRRGQVDCTVAKNRHGPTGEFVLAFDGDTTTFKDYEEQGL